MDPRLQELADLITRETTEAYQAWQARHFPASTYDGTRDCTATIVPGKKYTKIDVGNSGKYMVDQDGTIYGVKGYGVVHKGHCYGTLDTIHEWNWSGYTATRRNGRG